MFPAHNSLVEGKLSVIWSVKNQSLIFDTALKMLLLPSDSGVVLVKDWDKMKDEPDQIINDKSVSLATFSSDGSQVAVALNNVG